MSIVSYISNIMNWFMKLHTLLYKVTNGIIGSRMFGMDILLLTTKGRKTGRDRIKPLAYFLDGKSYVVVASAGGSPKNPDWFLNLEANPEVKVQIKNKKFQAMAKTALKSKRDRLWKNIIKQAPNFDQYQKKTKRQIPIVLLQPQK